MGVDRQTDRTQETQQRKSRGREKFSRRLLPWLPRFILPPVSVGWMDGWMLLGRGWLAEYIYIYI
jgi:hypothetical protein